MSHSEPLIQIVDKNDKPIGVMSIKDAHEKGAVHRVVRVMVENPKNKKILLQKRSSQMRRWPNCWDNSAAGHVDEGEDYLTAAKRELSEEIGINANKLEEVGGYYSEKNLADNVTLKRFNKVYKSFSELENFNIDEVEVSEVRWFTLEEIKDMVRNKSDKITDGIVDVINRYYS